MEEKLLQLLIKKPDRGLEKLMDTYAGLVYTIVYGKLASTCSKEDIEECVSSIFFELYQKRENIDLNKGSIKSFLATLSQRRAIDMFRKSSKDMGNVFSLQEVYDNQPEAESGISDVCEQYSRNESKELLIEGIKDLGEPDSEIFIRKYYFGQDTKTIARLLNLKENTVDKKVSRGLSKLRERLGRNNDFSERGADSGR